MDEPKELSSKDVLTMYVLTLISPKVLVYDPNSGNIQNGFLVMNTDKVNYKINQIEHGSTNKIIAYICIKLVSAHSGLVHDPHAIGILTEPLDQYSILGWIKKSEFNFLGVRRQIWITEQWAERVTIENPVELLPDAIIGYEDEDSTIPVRIYDVIPGLKELHFSKQPPAPENKHPKVDPTNQDHKKKYT